MNTVIFAHLNFDSFTRWEVGRAYALGHHRTPSSMAASRIRLSRKDTAEWHQLRRNNRSDLAVDCSNNLEFDVVVVVG